jgi:hypothetical protein
MLRSGTYKLGVWASTIRAGPYAQLAALAWLIYCCVARHEDGSRWRVFCVTRHRVRGEPDVFIAGENN